MKRYLVLAEGHSRDQNQGKTAYGVIAYGDPTVAVVDSQHAGETLLGVPIVASVDAALERYEPTTALVGIAPPGGVLTDEWRQMVRRCIDAGLDIESGLHRFLGEDRELATAARERGVEIRDLRRPPDDLDVFTGAALHHDATTVFTVGSDCSSGKMTVAIELDRAARARGLRSVFVPTGQSGIAIAGWGIAVDAVISDFVAGAAERLVLEGAEKGDLLWVEGQGSLVNPMYSGVTLSLYHGSAPNLLVLCHVARQRVVAELPEHPLPPLQALVELYERSALPARPAQVAAIALNTSALGELEARAEIAEAAELTGLPVDDPVRFGADALLDVILGHARPAGDASRDPAPASSRSPGPRDGS